MSEPNPNPTVAAELDLDKARAALAEIVVILDGDPTEPGVEWTSSEIEEVANVIVRLGFQIRQPGEEYA